MERKPTPFIWTSGISNTPLNDRDSRYTFFEIDTKDINKLHTVTDVYREELGSVYIHELTNGFHFFNLQAISKERYWSIIKKIKHLNPECPLTVLRLIHNKWENEAKYFRKGIVLGFESPELNELKTCIENQSIAPLKGKYELVNYPYEECPTCKRSDNIVRKFDFDGFIFWCNTCNIQTIGRTKKRKYSLKFGWIQK